jgi:hypothetical protein
MVRAPTSGDNPLQIAQLVVLDATGANVARGKPCSVSSAHPDPTGGNCATALDGTASARNFPYVFHSGNPSNDWFRVDLGANYLVKTVIYYNRSDCCSQRMGGGLLQLYDPSNNLWAQRSMDASMQQTYTF